MDRDRDGDRDSRHGSRIPHPRPSPRSGLQRGSAPGAERVSCSGSWAVTTGGARAEPEAGVSSRPAKVTALRSLLAGGRSILRRPLPAAPGECHGKPVRAGRFPLPAPLPGSAGHAQGSLLWRGLAQVGPGCPRALPAASPAVGSGCPHHPVTMGPMQPLIPEGKNVSRKETKTEKGNSQELSVQRVPRVVAADKGRVRALRALPGSPSPGCPPKGAPEAQHPKLWARSPSKTPQGHTCAEPPPALREPPGVRGGPERGPELGAPQGHRDPRAAHCTSPPGLPEGILGKRSPPGIPSRCPGNHRTEPGPGAPGRGCLFHGTGTARGWDAEQAPQRGREQPAPSPPRGSQPASRRGGLQPYAGGRRRPRRGQLRYRGRRRIRQGRAPGDARGSPRPGGVAGEGSPGTSPGEAPLGAALPPPVPTASRPAGGPGADSPACAAPAAERPRAPGRSGRAPRSAAGPEPAAAAGPVGGILRPGLPGAPAPGPPRRGGRTGLSTSSPAPGAFTAPRTAGEARPRALTPGGAGNTPADPVRSCRDPEPGTAGVRDGRDAPRIPPRGAAPAAPQNLPPPPQLLGGSRNPPLPPRWGHGAPRARHRHRLLGETRPAAAAPEGAGAGGARAGPQHNPGLPEPGVAGLGRGSRSRSPGAPAAPAQDHGERPPLPGPGAVGRDEAPAAPAPSTDVLPLLREDKPFRRCLAWISLN
ncbi:basic proline-rich protein-like [Pithys albifrons albifrons]|uniref:basic proline-rich protein-like n=1 Tax=Pithys albifrons albifrons TaxID=3385563 RepID=UPI003A5CE00F